MSVAPARIAVEIVKAGASVHLAISLQLFSGATVGDALRAGCERLGLNDIAALADQVGVFGQRCNLERLLLDGDRIELYRPLLLDAKAARRLRAERAPKRTR